MRVGLSVGEVMTKKPIVIPRNLTVKECAKIMSNLSIGSLLVVEDSKLLGLITQSDIIDKVVSTGKNPSNITAEEIMTEGLLTVSPDYDVTEAMYLLSKHDVRHLPVLENEKLVGFLTVKDILKIEPQLFELLVENIHLREEERKLRLRFD